MRLLQSALTLAILSSPVGAAQRPCTFPAQAHTCSSPNSHWSLRWQEATEASSHVLLVVERGKPERQLLTFNRQIDAIWSPDSNRIAITDHSGSSDSDLLVADLRTLEVVNVEQMMKPTPKSMRPVYANGHRYFGAVQWQSRTRLVFEVLAYDTEPGREVRRTFIFDAATKIIS